MKLIGFLSRDNYFPAPLISVVSDGKAIHAIFPSGDRLDISDQESIQSLEASESFLKAKPGTGQSTPPKMAFGVSREVVFSGAMRYVSSSLRDYIVRTEGIGEYDREAILEFVQVLNELCGSLSADDFINNLPEASPVVARLTPRKLKHQRGRTQTLVVQRMQSGQTKTLYRKGIPLGKNLTDMRIPQGLANFLREASAA